MTHQRRIIIMTAFQKALPHPISWCQCNKATTTALQLQHQVFYHADVFVPFVNKHRSCRIFRGLKVTYINLNYSFKISTFICLTGTRSEGGSGSRPATSSSQVQNLGTNLSSSTFPQDFGWLRPWFDFSYQTGSSACITSFDNGHRWKVYGLPTAKQQGGTEMATENKAAKIRAPTSIRNFEIWKRST